MIVYLYPGTVANAMNMSALSGKMYVVSISSSSSSASPPGGTGLPLFQFSETPYNENNDVT